MKEITFPKEKSRIQIQKEKETQIKKRKRKERVKSLLWKFFLLLIFLFLLRQLFALRIRQIVVIGNDILSDQEVIDLAGIRNYPSTLKNSSAAIEKRILESDFIEKVTVKKKDFLTKVVIEVDENRPLFYYQVTNRYLLEDGRSIEGNYSLPILLNEVPSDILEELIRRMKDISLDVLEKMSEIRYYPEDANPKRFLIAMNDGNYVYITLTKFDNLNNYLEYLEGSNQKKGIFYLDSGYLDVKETKKKK